jgi:hypothetical protein
MNSFAAALVALFNAPGSDAAVYVPTGGPASDVRAILSSPDQTERFGAGEVVLSTNVLELMRSDIPRPASGDLIIIMRGGSVFKTLLLQGEPLSDVEGLTWRMGAEEA